MKAAVAATFFLVFSVFEAQSETSPVKLESSAPSLEIVFAGQGSDASIGTFYHFSVRNRSSHGVIGFHVFQIPDSVQKSNGVYACNESCSGTSLVGDSADPMIKPGEAFDLHVPIEDAAKWPTMWADAAIFDNYTYQGDEKRAARLGVEEIGNQAEFDRVKPLLDAIENDASMSDSAKGDRLHSELSALSTDVEPEMIQRFNFWFPKLSDCDHEYARLMSGTAVSARDVISRDLEKFDAGGYGSFTFSQWIEKTNIYLKQAHIGCAGCAALPAAGASAPSAFQACTASSSKPVSDH